MINVMIADPESLVREGIKQLLAAYEDIKVICESQDAVEAFELSRKHLPDVLILEIAIAGHGGVRIVQDIKRILPSSGILVMSHRCERSFALRAFRAGAAGFISKDDAAEELAEAVRTVAHGRPYVSDAVSELLAESLAGGYTRRRHETLSDSDFEILCLTANGIPTARVAAICHVSPAAVRSRRNKMMEKMLLRTDAEVVEYALKNNLIDRSHLLH